MSTPLRFMDKCPRCGGAIVAKQCLNGDCSLGQMTQNEQELTVDLEHAEAERDALLTAAKEALSCSYDDRLMPWYQHLKAAIAKAEGKP